MVGKLVFQLVVEDACHGTPDIARPYGEVSYLYGLCLAIVDACSVELVRHLACRGGGEHDECSHDGYAEAFQPSVECAVGDAQLVGSPFAVAVSSFESFFYVILAHILEVETLQFVVIVVFIVVDNCLSVVVDTVGRGYHRRVAVVVIIVFRFDIFLGDGILRHVFLIVEQQGLGSEGCWLGVAHGDVGSNVELMFQHLHVLS